MNSQNSNGPAIADVPVTPRKDIYAFPTTPRTQDDIRRAWLVFGNLISLDVVEIDFTDPEWSCRVHTAIEGIAQAIRSSDS